MSFLNKTGVTRLLEHINLALNSKVTVIDGKGLSTNDFTNEEKNKLAGIAEKANNYVHPTSAGNKHIPTGGAQGQVLQYASSGTAKWADLPIASSSAAGLVKSGTDITVDSSGNVSINDNSHNHTAANINAGTLDIARIPVVTAAKGGTGQTSLVNSANALLNALGVGNSTPVDADYYISQYINGGTTTTTYHRRPMSALWAYIKGKANSVYVLASEKGAANGIAELDANGKVPTAQLPSYVDDVLEYAATTNFPTTGETGKIYVATGTNKTYRWSGSAYVEISASLALGTTSSTAYRGDYGNAAYTHAVTNKGAAFANGLYKITTNAEGHITAATAVTKADITALGIPSSDTNTWRGIQNNLTSTSTTDSLSAAQGKILNEKFSNYLPLSGGTLTGNLSIQGILQNGAIDVHPESSTSQIAYFMNDLCGLRFRGGSCSITGASTTIPDSTSDALFDGTTSYAYINVSSTSSVVTILIKSFQDYAWGTKFGIGFGAANWRAKDVKWELGYATSIGGDPADDAWVTILNVTNNTAPVIVCSGNGPTTGGSSKPWNTMRITLTNFNTTTARISGIWSINYTSRGLASTLLPRIGGQIYGDIYPVSSGAINLGSSSKLFANIYGTSFSGNAATATTASKLSTNGGSATQPVYFSNGVPVACTYTLSKSVPSNAVFTDTTYNAATTSTAGLMSAADKIKLDGIATGANKTTIDSSLSTSSTNPVQNKVLSRLTSTLIPIGTAIPQNANLNTSTYITVGNYYCSANATVATLTNCPTTQAFMMQVYSPLTPTIDNESSSAWVYRLRRLTTHTGEIYQQLVSSNATAGNFTYQDWKKISDASDLANKVDKVNGKGLSTNDFTTADKSKLDGITASADSVSFTQSLTSGTAVGTITINGTSTTLYCQTNTNTDTKVTTASNTSTTKLYVTGCTGATTGTLSYNSNVYINCSTGVLYGAAWNDYAEYRIIKETVKPGRCVIEQGDDTLVLSSERLQPGANIVSDTFGFAIGETNEAKTPLAVAGRVLAYPYEERTSFKAGDPVCSGPNGTVSKMTREEVMKYPERIIGTVSAVPTYETWGQSNVRVDGRIWIKIS